MNAPLWEYLHTPRLAAEEDAYFADHPLFDADARALDARFAVPGRLVDLGPRVLLTAHGRLPADTGAALDKALQRAQRLVDDLQGAVWYGARRVWRRGEKGGEGEEGGGA